MTKKNNTEKNNIIKIGFDFDKVLVDYPPLIPDWLINRIYKKKNKTLTYRFPNKLEQKIRILSHYPFFRHPIWDHVKKVQALAKNDSYHLYLVSGRFGFLDKRTETWLKKFPLTKHFKEVHFNFENNQPHFFKDKMIKKLAITHYIDDDLELIKYLAKHNPSVSFYWLNNTATKKTFRFKNIYPIKNLGELPKI